MQNRYVCDIGDFGKYALLRALIRDDLRLGVVWYLNPNEEENCDGSLVTYLQNANESGFRSGDPELYDALRRLLRRGQRNILSVQQSGILRAPTLFYDAPLTFAGVDLAKRKGHRDRWCREALEATEKAQIVFFDPDNGLPGKTAKPWSKNGPKYVFPEELLPYVQRDQSLIVYQHRNRTTLSKQIEAGKKIFRGLAEHSTVWALTHHNRMYFVMPSLNLENILRERLHEFVAGPWKDRFRTQDQDLLTSPSSE